MLFMAFLSPLVNPEGDVGTEGKQGGGVYERERQRERKSIREREGTKAWSPV